MRPCLIALALVVSVVTTGCGPRRPAVAPWHEGGPADSLEELVAKVICSDLAREEDKSAKAEWLEWGPHSQEGNGVLRVRYAILRDDEEPELVDVLVYPPPGMDLVPWVTRRNPHGRDWMREKGW